MTEQYLKEYGYIFHIYAVENMVALIKVILFSLSLLCTLKQRS